MMLLPQTRYGSQIKRREDCHRISSSTLLVC